jgi:hypothetical protein
MKNSIYGILILLSSAVESGDQGQEILLFERQFYSEPTPLKQIFPRIDMTFPLRGPFDMPLEARPPSDLTAGRNGESRPKVEVSSTANAGSTPGSSSASAETPSSTSTSTSPSSTSSTAKGSGTETATPSTTRKTSKKMQKGYKVAVFAAFSLGMLCLIGAIVLIRKYLKKRKRENEFKSDKFKTADIPLSTKRQICSLSFVSSKPTESFSRLSKEPVKPVKETEPEVEDENIEDVLKQIRRDIYSYVGPHVRDSFPPNNPNNPKS